MLFFASSNQRVRFRPEKCGFLFCFSGLFSMNESFSDVINYGHIKNISEGCKLHFYYAFRFPVTANAMVYTLKHRSATALKRCRIRWHISAGAGYYGSRGCGM